MKIKQIIKQLLCDDNGKISLTRFYVIIPTWILGAHEFIKTNDNSVTTAWGCAILIFAGCFGLSFNTFVENGCIQKLVDAICQRIGKGSDQIGSPKA